MVLYCPKWWNSETYNGFIKVPFPETPATPETAMILMFCYETATLFGSGGMTERDLCRSLESLLIHNSSARKRLMGRLYGASHMLRSISRTPISLYSWNYHDFADYRPLSQSPTQIWHERVCCLETSARKGCYGRTYGTR